MGNVVALVRVSSEEQAEQGRGGIERQWRDIEAVAARENLTIVERFQLEDVSGSTVQLHPKFRKMLESVSMPGIGGLVISSPDRLMRCSDLSDLAILAPFGKEADPKMIWTAESRYDLRKLDGQLLFLMQTVIGGHEKKQILARTQAGKTLSRERGDKCADKPPLGVEFVITDPKGRTGYYRYTPDADRIRRAFFRMLDRDTSIQALGKELGFPSYQSMRKQLTNPIWTGVRRYDQRREKLPPGPNGELRSKRVPRLVPLEVPINLNGAPPLISKDVFDEVQQVLATVNKEYVTRKTGKTRFEFLGLLRCACGQRYYAKHDTRKGKTGYYQCKSGFFDATKGCGNPHLKRAETDEKIHAALAATLGTPERLTTLLVGAITPKDHSGLKTERLQLERKLETLTSRRTRIIESIGDGLLSGEEAKVAIGKVRTEIEAASNRVTEIDRKLKTSELADVDKVVAAVVKMFRSLKFQPREFRRRVILELVQEIQMNENKWIKSIRLKLNHLPFAVKSMQPVGTDSWLQPT